MEFRYRFVPYGTSFSSAEGLRSCSVADVEHPGILYENEIAVDVGGVTWGCSGCDLPVVDHHFPRDDGGQFPSASAAVLHLAARIKSRFKSPGTEPKNRALWLVSHQSPDFDAFCALYLVRQLILNDVSWPDGVEIGLAPSGWLDLRSCPRLNWFNPVGVAQLDDPRLSRLRSLILMASVASCTDNGRRLGVPKTKAMHSVLYAAIRRGRPYENGLHGAVEFFDEAIARIEERQLNPLFDSVFDGSALFTPELHLLENEAEAYKRDLKRARVAVVNVQRSLEPFRSFYDPLAASPLLDPDGNIRSSQLHGANQLYTQEDAVFLRDPECLLFKEWARIDTDNSPSGGGFKFTAIAYSGGRANGELNNSDYYFALDPETADGRHLYGVWSSLQAAEAKAQRARNGESSAGPARSGFEARAGSDWAAEFSDPWFDAPNYACTIVATPNRGSLIGPPGVASDLSDDPIVRLVRLALEYSTYTSPFEISDFSCIEQISATPINQELAVDAPLNAIPPTLLGHFRLVAVGLHSDVNCRNDQVAAQIGDSLWKILMPEESRQVPTELRSSNVMVTEHWVAVWSRRGVGIAHLQEARGEVDKLRRDFAEIAAISRELDLLTSDSSGNSEIPVNRTYSLLTRAIQIRQKLSLPEGRLLRQFYEALNFGDVLQSLGELHADTVNKRHLKELQATLDSQLETQGAVEWLEVIIITVYCTELVEILLRTAGAGRSHFWDLAALIFVGCSAFCLTIWHLKPWQHSSKKRGGVVPALLILLILGAVAVAIWRSSVDSSRFPQNDLAPALTPPKGALTKPEPAHQEPSREDVSGPAHHSGSTTKESKESPAAKSGEKTK